MKRLLDIAVVVSTCCALVVVALLLRREFAPTRAPQQGLPTVIPRPERLAHAGLRVGAAGAPVQIVVFSDYQCPYCRVLARSLDTVQARHPDDVAVIYRHLPLAALHPHARNAALASECANAQGRFESFHASLFERQDSIGHLGWEEFARRAKVADLDSFAECVRTRRYDARVDEDLATAQELALDVTPAMILDGKLYRGAVPTGELLLLTSAAVTNRNKPR